VSLENWAGHDRRGFLVRARLTGLDMSGVFNTPKRTDSGSEEPTDVVLTLAFGTH
jgi:hypothetical protein